MPDAIVIGAGPNGLVAANRLASAGWSVVVLEANAEPGGAVRSSELTGVPGFVSDWFSAFYPLGVASPAMRALELEQHGLEWVHAPVALAHPTPDGRTALLSRDLDQTAASLDAYAPGDGDAWRRLYARWRRAEPALLPAVLGPLPGSGAAFRMLRQVGPVELARITRIALGSGGGLGSRTFAGEGGRLLLAGNLLHTDLDLRSALGGQYAWMLASLGQEHGFPVPRGGAGRLTDALVARLRANGGELRCDARVSDVIVREGRAVAVRTADGVEYDATRAVVADTSAPALYRDLVGEEHLPASFPRRLRRFRWDHATVKVDWALSAPVPWSNPAARQAGTVHVGESIDALATWALDVRRGRVPQRPFLLVGQMTTSDPTRSPAGTESLWAYTHVPQGAAASMGDAAAYADRMEAEIERMAPGFRELVLGRHVFSPSAMERADANLVGGAVNGGTSALRQQLWLRPVPGSLGARTPIRNLYLGSASAHPGGGVHGMAGSNAAGAALHDAP
jgi:phytoene dehydrogenase-like protein